MTEFVIEKDIPLPHCEKAGLVSTLMSMEIGDSVFVEGEKPTVAYVANNAKNRAQRKTDFWFVSRTVDGGIRLWRTV